ncbi:MBL fold metallo-hydrolase [uncultured Chitinophaga sp.]|uniref:MBL fold metallo-hydrolase n=1 Tax=uncultured Chitinophaga sp. TaxID=339340 RepID=UPI0025E73FF2|nr:MBL fold metallo-hydrolase [uncultured Chitinophaga sp.]
MRKITDYKYLPGVVHWRVGRKIVSTLNDGYFQANKNFLQGVSHYETANLQRKALRPEEPLLTINAFVIQSEFHKPILVDSGYGCHGVGSLGHVKDALAMAGVTPEEIEVILITHMHSDHIGGLTDDEGNKLYPNAKIWINRIEYDYWIGNHHLPGSAQKTAETAEKLLAPYKHDIRLFEGDAKLLPGITAVPLYGHTPGHTGFRITEGGDELLIWGDVVQLQAVQGVEPMAGSITDSDSVGAALTRRNMLEEAADNRWLVAGMHIEFPGVAYVERFEKGFRLVPELWVNRI